MKAKEQTMKASECVAKVERLFIPVDFTDVNEGD